MNGKLSRTAGSKETSREGRSEITLRIVLQNPPSGVDFGLQNGSGNAYETVEKQRSGGKDLSFSCALTVKNNRADGLPNFTGPMAQGPPATRFIYLDIGQSAGQKESCWSRRLKIPLVGIKWEMIKKAAEDEQLVLETKLRGTGKDGGPTCGTVRHPVEWKLVRR
jgi:hypothetical protein